MIFVSMVIEAQSGRQAELASAMATMMATTRAEAGCITYTYSRDLEYAERFHLVEIWENEALMNAHIDAAHAADFVKVLNEMARITSVKAFSGEVGKMRIRAPNPR